MPLNIEEEKKFEALRKNCRDLGVPSPPEIHIGFEVVDKNGDLIFKDRQRGHSWTRNFYNMLFTVAANCQSSGSTFGPGGMNSLRTNGVTITGEYLFNIGLNAQVPNTSSGYCISDTSALRGIIIGTSDTAFDTDHSNMAAKISAGTGSGEMAYGAMAKPVLTYSSTSGSESWTATHSRVFNNNSGGSIIVKETGIIATYYAIFVGSNQSVMLERSVLDPTVTVPNGAQLTVSYDISMDFSAIDAV